MSLRDHDPSNKIFSGSGDIEVEKADFTVSDSDSSHHALQRQLKNRHIAMIR
jgi:amino acid permease